jgi:hypothetical protein
MLASSKGHMAQLEWKSKNLKAEYHVKSYHLTSSSSKNVPT